MRLVPRLLLVGLMISGCETLPPMPDMVGDVVLSGRIKITQGEQISTFNFRWSQTERGFDAYFWGVMGAGTTRLFGDAETLSIEGRDVRASGPAEEILRERLGWSMPVELLLSWVRGLPDGRLDVTEIQRDEDGVVIGFRQAEWRLRFAGFDASGGYGRMTAQRGDVKVLVVIRERLVHTPVSFE